MVFRELDKIDYVESLVNRGLSYFVQYSPDKPFIYAGWKYTIVGNTVENVLFLYEALSDWLFNTYGLNFKIGTSRLINSGVEEQQYKLMTIYIDKELDADKERLNAFSEELFKRLVTYVIDPSVKLDRSVHVSGAVYSRHDIDEHGNYIPA